VALPSALALAEEGALAGERSREIDTARRADPWRVSLTAGFVSTPDARLETSHDMSAMQSITHVIEPSARMLSIVALLDLTLIGGRDRWH
jgi:hypothetical protein